MISVSAAEIRASLPPDAPEDEAETLAAAEVEELEREREKRQAARDRLRRAMAGLARRSALAILRSRDDAAAARSGDSFHTAEAHVLRRRAVRMRDCSESRETLRHEAQGKEGACGFTWPLDGGEPRWFCGARDCPECQKITAHERRSLARLLARPGVVRHGLRFFTLTMPNVDGLGFPTSKRLRSGPRKGEEVLLDVNLLRAASDCYERLRELLENRKAKGKVKARVGVQTCWKCKGMVPTKTTRKVVRELLAAGVSLPETCYDEKKRTRVPWSPLCECSRPDRRSHAIHASHRNVETTWRWEHLLPVVGRSPDGRAWHVHLHVLVDVPWIEQAVLATLWQYCTLKRWPGGPANSMGAHVELPYVLDDGKKAYLKDVNDPERLERGIMEAIKYPTKVADFLKCPDRVTQVNAYIAWSLASRRRKLSHATGAWQGWEEKLERLEADDPEELVEAERDWIDPEELACPVCGALGEWKRIAVPDRARKRAVRAALEELAKVPR